MSLITLGTSFVKNSSLQIGDLIYYLGTDDTVKKLGPVNTIGDDFITCNATGDLSQLTQTSYIFFGKDNSKNMSGLAGYFMEVNLKNTSDSHVELFAVTSEIFISSN